MISNLKPNLKSIRKVAGWLWKRGWAEWGAGNISVNISGLTDLPQLKVNDTSNVGKSNNLSLLITISGSRMREMMKKPENSLCLVNVDEHSNRTVISLTKQNQSPSPTSEFESHLLIQQTLLKHRPDHKAVLHTHPAEIIALSQTEELRSQEALNEKLCTLLPELKIYLPEGVAYISYHESGSKALAQASAAAFKDFRVAIWEKHGIIATGPTLEEAFDATDLVTKAARIWFLIQSVK